MCCVLEVNGNYLTTNKFDLADYATLLLKGYINFVWNIIFTVSLFDSYLTP
jgi:hypothetical protein